ncbi:hypothetical protein OA105_00790 [Prochlorococcus sp. AH-736-B08]|nr:hypothetical protein [Prochlorococcus sp. AH-736-B08]
MKNSTLTHNSTMKKLILSSALSITSLAIAPSVLGGPGEPPNGKNTLNDCTTSTSTCPVTPTKFSTKIYKVALCESNPMDDARATGGFAPDWDGSGCAEVYNSDSGEETGDIFSDTGATLSSENITIPEPGTYNFVAALFDKDFNAASHHMVYAAGGGPINDKRYVSTSGGGAEEGVVGEEQMISGEFNTFGPAIRCSDGSNMADRIATTGNSGIYTNFLSGGESFYGRILKNDFTLATQNLGNINSNNATCGGAKYLLSIVDKTTTITENSAGIHIKILAPKGLMRVDQGNSNPADGVVTGFSAHGESMAVSVSPVAGD